MTNELSNIKKIQNNEIEFDERTLAFLICDGLDITISDLCRYIDYNSYSIDICTVRKNYVQIQLNGNNIYDILNSYIYDKLSKVEGINMEDCDYRSVISDNFDIFFNLSESDNDVITIELAEYN